MLNTRVLHNRNVNSPARDQTGAEIVEFLITLPVILIVLAIIVDFGVAYTDQNILINATRAAVREVVQGASDAQAQQAADLITRSLVSHNPGDPMPPVSVTRTGTNPGDMVSVTIAHDFDFFLLPHFLGAITDIDLTATSVMRMQPQ